MKVNFTSYIKHQQNRISGSAVSFNMRIFLIFILLISATIAGQSQITGDYRSVTTGNWTTLATWQRYSGAAWVTPTILEGYPGQFAGTGAVDIQSGNTVTIGSTGITTTIMGTLTINSTGQLFLSGTIPSQIVFNINTPVIDIKSGGSIYFSNKVKLVLTTDAVVTLTIGAGALQGTCNNNVEIFIGAVRFAACAGAPGNVFTFEQLMLMGGTLNSIPTSNSPMCPNTTITLTGNYAGAIGTPPTYQWSVIAPGGAVTIYATQNVTIPSSVAGTYLATLKVSTVLSGTTYTNSETIAVKVNPFPSLATVAQHATVCDGSPATIDLTGLVPNCTFTLSYKINGVAQPDKTGLISSATGTSSFISSNLVLANNGQTLQVTGITITNPTTNCSTTFVSNATLSVWTTGGGTWTGAISSDWNDPLNWCGGVPTTTTDVYISPISVSVPNLPVIGAPAVCKNITIYTGASLTINGLNTLDVKGIWTNNGALITTTGTVSFTGAAAQTIGGTAMTAFHNLTLNCAPGVVANQNITVNGILNLASASPNETNGTLEMTIDYGSYSNVLTPIPNLTTTPTQSHDILNSWILFMGPASVTTGDGDVTGKVKRTSIANNTDYTFGSAFTTINFNQNGSGTLPSNVMFVITKGSDRGIHANKPNAVARLYQIIRTGGTAPTTFTLQLHYLASELNGNLDNNLVLWDHHIPYTTILTPHEHGKTSQNATEHWVALSGHGVGYLANQEVIGGFTKYWLFGNTLLVGNQWLGAVSSDWTNPSNWSGGSLPTCFVDVVIPSGVPFYPELPVAGANAKSITIQPGATLDGGSGNLTICGGIADNGGIGSWNNYGTFNAGSSTITFNFPRVANNETSTLSGSTDFYSMTLAASTYMILQTDVTVSVAGTFTKTGNMDASTNPNTFIYNGTGNQTVVVPDIPTYYNLTLTGGGTKTLPASSLNISGNLLSDVPVSATGNTILMNGGMAQTIGGSATISLNNLTINNINGISLGTSENVDGILNLSSGLVTTGSNTLKVTSTGSIINAGSTSYINGKLARVYSAAGSKDFPVGKGGEYRKLTLNYTAIDAPSTVTAEQFEGNIPGTIPANTDFQSRYWTLTQTGGTIFSYDLTLNGSPYNPGSGSPVILKGDGATNTALAATFSSPDFTATGQTSFSNFAVATTCPPPTITGQPVAINACEGDGAHTFTVSATVPLGVPTYQWFESITGAGGTFVALTDGGVYSDATTASLTITDPPLSMSGYAYKVIISRDCGFDATSNEVILTINQPPTITLGTSPEICSGSTSADLSYTAASGTPDEYSIDFDALALIAGFANVPYTTLGATPIVLTVPAAAPPRSYNGILHVRNTTTTCESEDYPFTVTIHALPQGTLTGSNICTGGISELTFTATAGTGPFSINLNPGNITVNDVISGTPFTFLPDPGVTTTYTVISVTSDPGCVRSSGFTGANATVSFVTPGTIITWDGSTSNDWHVADNWDLGYVPIECNNIVIPVVATQPTIYAPVICNDLTINAGASLTLEAGENLTVNGILTNSTGVSGLVIKSNGSFTGSLIESTSGVPATVERYLIKGAWHLISAPVDNAVSGIFLHQYLKPFDEPSNLFGQYIEPVDVPLPVGKGFVCWPVATNAYNYAGNLNTGIVSPAVTFTDVDKGYNLVGNPYPSAIDWDAPSGWVKTNIAATIYVWNQGPWEVGNYGTYNGAVGTNGVSRYIPAGQGFFVQTTGADPVLSMNNSVRVHDHTQPFLKSSGISDIIRLHVSNASGSDEIVVYFDPSASMSYNSGMDARKMFGEKSSPQVYSFKPNSTEKLSINVMPDVTKPLIVPVSVQAGINGIYQITASETENFDNEISIYLEDLKLNRLQNLKDEPVYEYAADTNDIVNRFLLHFSKGPIGIQDAEQHDDVTIYSFEKTVYVRTESEKSRGGKIYIYDMIGRNLFSSDLTGSIMNRFTPELVTGYYIVKVMNSTGVYTRKVYLY